MAVKNFYLLDSAVAAGGDYGAMQEDGTAPATANQATGWVIGTLAPTRYADMDRGVQVPRTDTNATFGYITTIPANAPDATRGNAFRTPNTLSGNFANANWTFSFVMRAPAGTAQRGAMRCRVYRSANADGSGATLVGTALETGITAAASTTNTTAITATMNPGALTLTNEYLFFVLTWKITTAGANNTSAWVITTNTNTKVLTSDLSVVLSKSATDSLSLADATASALTQARSATDTLSLADTRAAALSKARSATDSLSFADTRTAALDKSRTVVDTLSLVDSASSQIVPGGLEKSATDTLAVADGGAPARSLTLPRTLTDSLPVADTQARALQAARAATDSLSLADSNQRVRAMARSSVDSLALADSRSTVRTIARAMLDTLTLADAVSSQGAGQINRSISDALSTLDAVSTARSIARSNADALALADATVRLVTLTRALADALALADSEAAEGSLVRVLVDTLAVEDFFTSDAPLALPSELTPSDGRNVATLIWMLDVALPRSYRASNVVGKSQSTAVVVSDGRNTARVNR